MKVSLKEFAQLRTTLLKRQAELRDELAAIESALGTSISAPGSMTKASAAKPAVPVKGKRGPRKRAVNALSLSEAVIAATKAKPLSKADILTAVAKLGLQVRGEVPDELAQHTPVHP